MILRQGLQSDPLIAAYAEKFVAAMVRDIPPPPAKAAAIRAANLGRSPFVGA